MNATSAGFILIRTECTACGSPLPINALATTYFCSKCLTPNPLPKDNMTDMLTELYGAITKDYVITDSIWQSGEFPSQSWWRGGRKFFVQVARLKPDTINFPLAVERNYKEIYGKMPVKAEERTREPLQREWFEKNVAQGFLELNGVKLPLRELPQVFRAAPKGSEYLRGRRQFLLGEDAGQLPSDTPREGKAIAFDEAKPEIFQCPTCSAALKVDGSSRMITCSYCNTPSYFPDELWRRLHPATQAFPWYLIILPPTDAELAAYDKSQAERARQKAAQVERQNQERQAKRDQAGLAGKSEAERIAATKREATEHAKEFAAASTSEAKLEGGVMWGTLAVFVFIGLFVYFSTRKANTETPPVQKIRYSNKQLAGFESLAAQSWVGKVNGEPVQLKFAMQNDSMTCTIDYLTFQSPAVREYANVNLDDASITITGTQFKNLDGTSETFKTDVLRGKIIGSIIKGNVFADDVPKGATWMVSSGQTVGSVSKAFDRKKALSLLLSGSWEVRYKRNPSTRASLQFRKIGGIGEVIAAVREPNAREQIYQFDLKNDGNFSLRSSAETLNGIFTSETYRVAQSTFSTSQSKLGAGWKFIRKSAAAKPTQINSDSSETPRRESSSE
ncbi:MAG: hypothetical protein IAF08_08025 [Rhizobacter sp.]|nr:hypothetical protein [Chlorobiales bacterium]